MLSEEQRIAVQTTFNKIEANPDPFAATFYNHLFDQDHSLRTLFKNDLKVQGDVLVRMLSIAVAGLNYPDDLVPALHDLGLHHAGYGVKTKDYDTFGRVLLQTLKEFLGAEFTPDTAEAWATFYQFLSVKAIEGYNEQ